MANIRKIKIGRHFVPSNWKKTLNIQPKLVLQGNWLQKAGFEPHTLVQVEVFNGVLTISKKEVQNV